VHEISYVLWRGGVSTWGSAILYMSRLDKYIRSNLVNLRKNGDDEHYD